MNAVLDWVKSNIFIVVFILLMIAAAVSLPLVASSMNASIKADVESRARRLNELGQLERTQVPPPAGTGMGETRAMLVNEQLLEEYRTHIRRAQDDSERVSAAALAHNRKGRSVLMEDVLPRPPRNLEEIVPRRFYERLGEAYNELLEEVNAGAPPDLESLAEELTRREIQFRLQTLSKERDDPLTDVEQRELSDELTALRLLKYQEAAERMAMYASLDAFGLPGWGEGRLPSLSDLYEWQWQYWIHQDLLRALYNANKDDGSVLDAPVKVVQWVKVLEHSTGGSGGGTSSPDGIGGPVGLNDNAGGGTGGGMVAAPNPAVEAPLDFNISLTGRSTNPLYDVRYVDLELVVDSERVPEVLDAIAAENFMTVIRMRMAPANPYELAKSGYFVGASPVTSLSIRVETIWFRTWTSKFMPDAVKQRLGVSTDAEEPEYG